MKNKELCVFKPPQQVANLYYLRGQYFPSLGVKQNSDLPLKVVLNMDKKVKWSFVGRMRASNEKAYEPFTEEGAVSGMGS